MEATASARSRIPELTKYEVVDEIGHGGMATVYRARDKRLGREVAVKVIHPHLRDSREVVSRFHAEAQAVAKLRHPNIVEVFDVSEPDEAEQYLVAELLRGATLRKILQKKGPMPPEVAASVALELLAAVAHAHAGGVVHRDIKPENVLVEHRGGVPAVAREPALASDTPVPPNSGDRVIVKLTDFGIAKLLDAQGVTSTGQVLGSPAHMAPEQIEGADVDARADVFGMGVLLYECMVGHLPFEGSNPAQVLRRVLDGVYPEAQAERPVVGARWSQLLDRALAHAPGDRFPDANAMRDAISAELARLSIASPEKEIARWLDEPAEYAREHDEAMAKRLLSLGSGARKRGDALGAAADYNRALAYAPDDPQLLRIVTGMHRAEARARFVKRAGLAALLMAGLALVTFEIGRLVRMRAPSPAASHAVAVAPPPPSILAIADVVVPQPSARLAPPPPAALKPQATVAKPVSRTVTLQLTPEYGITVAVDGASMGTHDSGYALALDGKQHALGFSCPVCLPSEHDVPAGDDDQTVAVKLTIRPATLVIQGDASKTYQLETRPEIAVRAGTNSVPMPGSFANDVVKQIETGTEVHVRLSAGSSVSATF